MRKDVQQLLDADGLYRTVFDNGYEFLYRLLSLKEHRILATLRDTGQLTEFEVASAAFERCLVSGVPGGTAPAGLEVSIGRFIMWLSGDCDGTITQLKEDLQMSRRLYPALSVRETMKHWICVAQPYTMKEIDGWSRQRLFDEFAKSEAILVKKLPGYQIMDIEKIMTPEELAEQKAGKKQAPIDFKRDNAALMKNIGVHGIEEAKSIEHNQKKLSREQAKKLDRRSS